MKNKPIKRTLRIVGALLCAVMLSTGIVYADTDGTEIQVEQPVLLEIQLGPAWAGVEFQLKTDAGVYPGVILVDDDGVLRTELGGSENYVLSCLSSRTAAPLPNATQAPATADSAKQDTEQTESPADDESSSGEASSDSEQNSTEPPVEEENTVGGIPVSHIILFGGGMLLAIGSLVTLTILKKRRTNSGRRQDDYDDEDDDY